MCRAKEVYENTYKRHTQAHAELEGYLEMRGYDPDNDPYFDSDEYFLDVAVGFEISDDDFSEDVFSENEVELF